MIRVWMAAFVGLCTFGVGCNALPKPEPSPQQYASRTIDEPDLEKVFEAARAILVREFGRVEPSPPAGGRLVSTPKEFSSASQSGTMRDMYGGRSRMRRVATFLVGKRGDKTVARLRVDLERKDEGRAAATQVPTGRLDDYPSNDTALARDAATTPTQNAVWTKVSRDRQLERELLSELVERFSPEPAIEESAESPDEDAP